MRFEIDGWLIKSDDWLLTGHVIRHIKCGDCPTFDWDVGRFAHCGYCSERPTEKALFYWRMTRL